MQDSLTVEAMKTELADKKAMLADIEAGKVSLGIVFDNRVANLQQRVAELETQIRTVPKPQSP